MIRKTDRNHSELIRLLRKIPNLTVFSTHAVGSGFPDIVVGYKGKNYLIEIKDGAKPPSQRKLTPDEIKFHESWKGQIDVVISEKELLKVLKIEKKD